MELKDWVHFVSILLQRWRVMNKLLYCLFLVHLFVWQKLPRFCYTSTSRKRAICTSWMKGNLFPYPRRFVFGIFSVMNPCSFWCVIRQLSMYFIVSDFIFVVHWSWNWRVLSITESYRLHVCWLLLIQWMAYCSYIELLSICWLFCFVWSIGI